MCFGMKCQFERWDGECGNWRMQGKQGSACCDEPDTDFVHPLRIVKEKGAEHEQADIVGDSLEDGR